MYTLPELPFKTNELEPFFDEATIKIHHGKHHQAYVDNLNKALEQHSDLASLDIDDLLKNINKVPEDIKQVVINNAGGHYNHTFFWNILGKDGAKSPDNELQNALNDMFGSFDAFKAKFNEVALKRFGSGWAWLVVDADGKFEVLSTANQDSPLMQNKKPILGLDVWEHAYYLKYQNKRADYIEAFWNVINWDKVNRHFINR